MPRTRPEYRDREPNPRQRQPNYARDSSIDSLREYMMPSSRKGSQRHANTYSSVRMLSPQRHYEEPRSSDSYTPYDHYAPNIPPPPYFLPPVLRQSSVYGSNPPPPPRQVTYGSQIRHGYAYPGDPSYYEQFNPRPEDHSMYFAEEADDGVHVDFTALQKIQSISDMTAVALMPSIDAVTEVCSSVSRTLYYRTDDLQRKAGASTEEIESTAAELSSFAAVLANFREVLQNTSQLISRRAFSNMNKLLLFCKKALRHIKSVITTSRKIPSRLNFLKRNSLNSSLGKAKAVRLNLECLKTSLSAMMSTIVLAGRREEQHESQGEGDQENTATNNAVLANGKIAHRGKSSAMTYELDAAVEKSTSRLEDDILANSRAVKRWQQAERREFEERYVHGLVSLTASGPSPASQWISQLVPFPTVSNMKRLTGPAPRKAIGYGAEEVIASSSKQLVDDAEEQARIAAVVRLLLDKWTQSPSHPQESNENPEKSTRSIPLMTTEVIRKSRPQNHNQQYQPTVNIPGNQLLGGDMLEGATAKKPKRVSFEDAAAEDEIADLENGLSSDIAKPNNVHDPKVTSMDFAVANDSGETGFPEYILRFTNLQPHISEKGLREIFEKFGPVKSCSIDDANDRSGTVTMTTQEGANIAMDSLRRLPDDEHVLKLHPGISIHSREEEVLPPMDEQAWATFGDEDQAASLQKGIPNGILKEETQVFPQHKNVRDNRNHGKSKATSSTEDFFSPSVNLNSSRPQSAMKASVPVRDDDDMYGGASDQVPQIRIDQPRSLSPDLLDYLIENSDSDMDDLPKAGWETDERNSLPFGLHYPVNTYPSSSVPSHFHVHDRPQMSLGPIPYQPVPGPTPSLLPLGPYPPPPGSYDPNTVQPIGPYAPPPSSNDLYPYTSPYDYPPPGAYGPISSAGYRGSRSPTRSLRPRSEEQRRSIGSGFAETIASSTGDPSRSRSQRNSIRSDYDRDRSEADGYYTRRERRPTPGKRDASISGSDIDEEDFMPTTADRKALILREQSLTDTINDLEKRVKMAELKVARKDELLRSMPSLKHVESLEADVARLRRENQEGRERAKAEAEAKAELEERSSAEKAEQIATLQASVTSAEAKVATLEGRLSRRDATIERLKKERDKAVATVPPAGPSEQPPPEAPAVIPPVDEVVEVIEEVDDDPVGEIAVSRRRRSISDYSYYTHSFSHKSWTEEKLWDLVRTVGGFTFLIILSVFMAASLATYIHSDNGLAVQRVMSIIRDSSQSLVLQD